MKHFTYRDALAVLGEDPLVGRIDKVLSGTMLGGAVFGIDAVLSWFDAKADFIKLSKDAIGKLTARSSGMSRATRTERLQAAHTILLLVSFFEMIDELDIPLSTKDLELTKELQRGFLGQQRVLPSPADMFLRIPRPADGWINFHSMPSLLMDYLEGLHIWDTWNDTQRSRVMDRILGHLPRLWKARYLDQVHRLAVDSAEFGLWLSGQEHEATRQTVGNGLAELTDRIERISVGGTPSAQRHELAGRYRAALNKPTLAPGLDTAELTIPPLAVSYVNPRFQIAPHRHDSRPTEVDWWQELPVREDIEEFLAGYLTSPWATALPMLVLGDPGAGKSMLTKVLAARLPATDFLTIRVELRDCPSEADIVGQLNHALSSALLETSNWRALCRDAGQALPVILLDGFDELLQATGTSHTGYLGKVVEFQEASAELGAPVAVIITSRMSVANRAKIPDEATVLRLLPFDEEQAARWLRTWNQTNGDYFSAAGVRPLNIETAWRHQELAQQPLLLLMLALYDASANELQCGEGELRQSDLYERLLTQFIRREVVKEDTDREDIEADLEQLAVVAFAMFNRGAQWITEDELDRDLNALLGMEKDSGGTRTPLSPSERVLGRFFFVHRTQATRDDAALRTYEFLHATFGEYLVARHTWLIVEEIQRVQSSRSRRSNGPDDSELCTLLSAASLCSRRKVVDFLRELARPDGNTELLLGLFRTALDEHPPSSYRPVRRTPVARAAIYQSNLMVLLLCQTKSITVSDLLGYPPEVGNTWAHMAALWQSQVPGDGWGGLVHTVDVHRIPHTDQMDLRLSIGATRSPEPIDDLSSYWRREELGRTGASGTYFRQADFQFLRHPIVDALRHSIPMIEHEGRTLELLVHFDGRVMSGTRLLMEALTQPGTAAGERLLELNEIEPLPHWMRMGMFRLGLLPEEPAEPPSMG
ncbi:hypothetical protein D5S17_04285 [Pseudonocardiaceae bacterium YIM PH 21723]|nr:hypothetical protein D5S17_04285 [Pseudonocardiaceae bacterium YIM PH 21723]